ncbi:MAG TPA: hypothetical protein VG125_17060 [Pirellulales bacterium]|jgi:hypothetical protein|nr:hypothetical protein [Pirellulales bacterium]
MAGWVDTLVEELAEETHWSYELAGSIAAEPTAIAALALCAHRRVDAAARACRRLGELQATDGSVGVAPDRPSPGWPTGWAVLAWTALATNGGGSVHQQHVNRAVAWMLSQHGRTFATPSEMGHDARLDGWPWVDGTHPWVEPTAVNLLALKATGHGQLPRSREAAAMLVDRLLPDGGSNYGNTTVLGQVLRPHVEPTGLALLALAGESDPSGRIERSLRYLENCLAKTPAAVSLAYGVMGLAAHGRRPAAADDWLAAAARQTKSYQRSPLRRGLIALAAAQRCPLVTV